eukprot:6639384-Alexandrium_andersonii.AAC.1
MTSAMATTTIPVHKTLKPLANGHKRSVGAAPRLAHGQSGLFRRETMLMMNGRQKSQPVT